MDVIRKRIADNIKRFRLEQGYSVDEVGKAVGKSGKTISAWEVGRGQPDADTLIALCRFFSVDVTDFYGEETDYSDEEKGLIDLYRSMSSDGRRAIVATAEALAGLFPGDD